MFAPDELERYERQIKVIGRDGQERLKAARVLVAGAGGLGSAVTLYLTAAGIGHIRIIDRDTVKLSDLNRQLLYRAGDKGKFKAECARERLRDVNPTIDVETRAVSLEESNVDELTSGADLLVDALDNWPSRYLLNGASIARGVPLIHGAAQAFFGQITTIVPAETACLECIFPEAPNPTGFPIIGPVCGLIGSLQAMEVIKLLLNKGSTLKNRLLVLDGLYTSLEEIPVRRSPDCFCSQGSP